MTGTEQTAVRMKADSAEMAASSDELRNAALTRIEEMLGREQEVIFAENKKDLEAAAENGVAEAVVKRLKFDEHKLADVCAGLKQLRELPDPLGMVTLDRELDEGLRLKRITCPIGVIGVIFEARPDALVQIASLCIKSGNCALLKGGKETVNTNRILFKLIHDSAVAAGLPENCLCQAESHAEIDELLACDRYVDLIIPRGSNAFVRHIMDNTKIPVMGHADGICHIFVDEYCDQEMAIRIIVDAKTQYTAACNAVETLLVHRGIADEFLPKLAAELTKERIKIRGTAEVVAKTQKSLNASSFDSEAGEGTNKNADNIDIETITDDDFETEYLSLTVGIRLVDDIDEAIRHINTHGSHHTDSIITDNENNAERFMQMVDSAGVYHNCSTRFSDGFRYGFGAEVGISTGKIHARGPVGLEGLVTYKYKLYGHGQIVGDYASGKSSFHHRDMQ
ncbi:MAG: glutamate-5-semialdehyde dehydrogenase [Eubacterium sp.]|nr:glutamate-5-semialdehyde dehydrogenase [Eubacterium sp.]